ncbi:MAG: hypothetical protein COV99_08110 [Bacteroidetes bacterium CG12_big_fil_rev_8_21_14_0_65_60_17]|nr:MAG: hypothetical protein COV99_08110 [Bacteroidetes bacterium CG12_big_fil_rev_8_21_14_0_65_60_17]
MRHVLIFIFLLACPTHSITAQDVDNSEVERFQLAESLLQAGQFDRAIPMLKELLASSPGTHVFYERLRQAYEEVKRYDEAIALVEDQMSRASSPEVFLVEKGRLQFLAGMETNARATWDSVLARQPASPSVYLMVYRSLLQVRLFDIAIEVLEKGRRKIGNADLFQTDLAQLYALTSRLDKAVEEYLGLLEGNPGQLSFVKSRLGPYMTDSSSIQSAVPPVESAVARDPLNRSYRELLSMLYVELERYEDAYQVVQAIDRLEKEEGAMLFSFAQTAADGGAWNVAVNAFEEVLRRYPSSPASPDALRGLGVMQEMWATELDERMKPDSSRIHYSAALATYERFMIDYPQHTHVPDVLTRMGRLQQDVLGDLESAERILSEVTARYPGTRAADEAAFSLGKLAIMTDRLTDARIRFTRLVTRLRTGDLADASRLELAQLHFYQGQFDAAVALAEAMQENSFSDVSNDAIGLKVLINESKGPDSLNTALRRFARAELERRQRNTDHAVMTLNFLIDEFGDHPIIDNARFLRAGLLADLGQTDDAMQAYLEIPLIHPMSFFGDRSLFQAAVLARDHVGDPDRAIELFERLLTDYPRSLLTSDARMAIRVLRGEQV